MCFDTDSVLHIKKLALKVDLFLYEWIFKTLRNNNSKYTIPCLLRNVFELHYVLFNRYCIETLTRHS